MKPDDRSNARRSSSSQGGPFARHQPLDIPERFVTSNNDRDVLKPDSIFDIEFEPESKETQSIVSPESKTITPSKDFDLDGYEAEVDEFSKDSTYGEGSRSIADVENDPEPDLESDLEPQITPSRPRPAVDRRGNPRSIAQNTNGPSRSASKDDLQDTLKSLAIDDPKPGSARRRRQEVRRARNEPKSFKPKKQRKWLKRLILIILLIAFGIAAFLGIKTYLISKGLLNGGSIISLLSPGTPLQTDSQGRTNILLFGTSQDDASHQDASGGGGLWLTDSIQLVSINQKAKTVKIVAIPRDLWVAVNNCAVGDYAKINAVYECASGLINSGANAGSNYSSEDKAGAKALMDTVSVVTGITPQYYVHANYTVLKQAVDAVGGVSVNIVGDGASGIYDTNFDWDCPNGAYTCKNVYYPKDGTYTLSGTQALFLARARADSGLYSYKDFGLARGDFDRQANQQKILIALQAKIKSASVFANPIALNGLLDAFGNNISQSMSGGELKTLLTFAKALPNSSIQSISLVSSGNEVVTTGLVSGQSVVVPTSGITDYSSISDYLTKQLSTNAAVAENATIDVYNASGVDGAAATEKVNIEALGLSVGQVGTASTTDAGSGKYTLYDLSNGAMPLTLANLKSSLKVTTTSTTLPSDITSTANFVVVVNQ